MAGLLRQLQRVDRQRVGSRYRYTRGMGGFLSNARTRPRHWRRPTTIRSGIGTYARGMERRSGLASLWTTLLTFPMMWTIQFVCAKIGMVTGGGLARVLRKHYSPCRSSTPSSPAWRWPIRSTPASTSRAMRGGDESASCRCPSRCCLIVPIALIDSGDQIFGSYRLLLGSSSGSPSRCSPTSCRPSSRSPTGAPSRSP